MHPRIILVAIVLSFLTLRSGSAKTDSSAPLHTFCGEVKAIDLAAKTVTIKSGGRAARARPDDLGREPRQRLAQLSFSIFRKDAEYLWLSAEKPAQTRSAQRIKFMKSSTKDKIKGGLREAKGKVKEETGKAIGNPNLRDRGADEKVAGKVQKKMGDVKKVFGK